MWRRGGERRHDAPDGRSLAGEDSSLGCHAHGRRTRTGNQMVEWAMGENLRFLLSFTRQACRDTWFHPKSWTGHPIDHLLCRPRDHRF